MTLGIIPESDRKGRTVCQSWLQGSKHNVTPTDKNPSDESHPRGPPDPPHFFREGRGLQGSRKNSLNKTHKKRF